MDLRLIGWRLVSWAQGPPPLAGAGGQQHKAGRQSGNHRGSEVPCQQTIHNSTYIADILYRHLSAIFKLIFDIIVNLWYENPNLSLYLIFLVDPFSKPSLNRYNFECGPKLIALFNIMDIVSRGCPHIMSAIFGVQKMCAKETDYANFVSFMLFCPKQPKCQCHFIYFNAFHIL